MSIWVMAIAVASGSSPAADASEQNGRPMWSGTWMHAGAKWTLRDHTLAQNGTPVLEGVVGVPAFGGGTVAVVHHVNAPVDTELVVWTRDEGRSVLVDEAFRPARVTVSSDGQHVAFVSGRTGLASVYVASVAGGTPVQLTNEGLSGGRGLPEGFVAPPRATPRFEGDQLCWTDPAANRGRCVGWKR